MAELKFVLKCLGITSLILFVLQFEISGVRAEKHVSEYLRSGTAVVWVREAVKGGYLLVTKSTTELAPKLSLNSLWPKTDTKSEANRNVSSDVPIAEFPDEEVGEDTVQKASVF